MAVSGEQQYDVERLRRTRAESLERLARMLRDAQSVEEVVTVFAATVSHDAKLSCAAYQFEGNAAVRRAFQKGDAAGMPDRFDAALLVPVFELDDLVVSSDLPPALREAIFASGEGAVASLRIDNTLWGAVVFASPRTEQRAEDGERKLYFRTLVLHLQLALTGAFGFERIQQLARALSETNEFKDDVLAMLAHDFKGPLTVILGYCELLLENVPSSMREELETIQAQTKRLVRLAEDAVALAQTQAGGFLLERKTLDLRSIVADAVKTHDRGDARIKLEEPDEPIAVWLDTVRFNHVLDNLLMNALKYSSGEVRVAVRRRDGNAEIAVTDRGIGIPAKELSVVFARFGRASNARRHGISGSGVGLYVSLKIVQVHGGTITVASHEGEGSTFTVTLPLADA